MSTTPAFQMVITVENGAATLETFFNDGSHPPSLLEKLGALDTSADALRRTSVVINLNDPEPEPEPASTWASIKAWFRS